MRTTPERPEDGVPDPVPGIRRVDAAGGPLRAAALTSAVLTSAAMAAFAANSVLCRLALLETGMDPVSFTGIRLLSGAGMLVLLAAARGRNPLAPRAGSWRSGWWLFVYAAGFSYAYVELTAGTGAVLLFGVVQLTMVIAARIGGERLGVPAVCGFALAGLGVGYLFLPTVARPAFLPAVSMAVAGAAWGFYSLAGRLPAAADPVQATTGNFLRSLPFVAAMVAIATATGCEVTMPQRGVWLAVASGAVASALGYVLWYAAVPRLGATRSAIVQLTAPVLAAVGGVLWAGESMSPRLLVAATLVLGGVFLAVRARSRREPTT